MKSIKNYSRMVHLFKNSEHYDFHKYVSDHTLPRISLIPESKPSWMVFHSLFEKEDIIFKRSSKSAETKYINDENQKRHGAFSTIRRKVSAGEISFDPVEKAASILLTEVLDNYKGISTASMVDASALIVNMLQDLGKERYSKAVGALDLTAAVSALEEANDVFRALYEERFQNLETIETQGTMKEIRVQVDKSFKLFTQSVDAVYAAAKLSGKEAPEAEEIIDYINGAIDQYERVLAHRGHAFAGKKPEGDEPEMPVPGTPTLAVSAQEIVDDYTMLLTMADRAMFELMIYPEAKGGKIILSADDVHDYYNEFPVKDFDVVDGLPAGLLVSPPDAGFKFNKPMYSLGPCHAELFKDDALLAVLTGVEWPGSYSN
ncbi:MAG: DUF6261 family protein [Tannerellaceae bacterium]|jgi:hypothetical protein|nr:DUF6261 family protein [Tannerellaceae bacterium]